jgi:hypothetical protein
MSVQVKRRRDTASNIAGFTPAQGEIIVDTTNCRMIVGDGATVGGFPAAKLSETVLNTAVSNILALGAHGSALNIQVAEQLVSGLSGASVNAGTQIPAGALVIGCAMRVTTTITGATSWTLGYGSGATLSAFGSGLALSAGSTNAGLIGPNPFYSATNIILTATGSNFTAGAARLALFYVSLTPPTS